MMKGTKILSVLVSAAMLSSTVGMTAFAAENDNTENKTYNYVALGDSIAAGFGLADGELKDDPALVITDELLENPVSGAYPAIFTEYLKELGEERGYEVMGTNLASTAYRAEDIEKTIKTPGYKGEFAASILERFVGEGASEVLVPYHDYYTKYLSAADLVSIQLGGNDIVMSIVPQMVFGDNPILQAAGTSLMLTLFGMDTETAIGGGLKILYENKDNITSEDFIEAAVFMYNVSQMSDQLVDDSASHVKGVVEAVQELNGDADIALVGMFNPYRTEEGSNKIKEEIYDILGRIYAEAATVAAAGENELTVNGKLTKDFIDGLQDKVNMIYELNVFMLMYKDRTELFEILDMVEKYDDINELKEIAAIMKASNGTPAEEELMEILLRYDDINELQSAIDIIKKYKDIEELTNLIDIMSKYRTASQSAEEEAIAAEIAAPLAMMLAGKNVDPQILRLNEELKVIAEETGATYVDVYNISPEDDFDPHPNANGHKEIAGILYDTMYKIVCGRMSIDAEVAEEESEPEQFIDIRATGDVNGDGKTDVSDVVFILAHITGIRPLTADEQKYADMDGNCIIDFMDMLILSGNINM